MSNKAKAKGTSYETLIKNYLISKGFPRARRAALEGGQDKGDIHGIEHQITGRQVAIQCKNQKAFQLSQWLNDTVEQAERLDNAVPALVVKRPGKGEKAVGESYVVMRLDDFVDLLDTANFQ
jgi:Holliday junction resolvase